MRALLVAMIAIAPCCQAGAQTVPFSYKIVADQKSESVRAVDVRIERRLDEADINSIAAAVVDREQRSYPRTIVNFLLPTTRSSDQPWASATLVREIRVRIPGLRLEEERLFSAEASIDKRDMIGTWLTSTPATPGRITIYREGRRIFGEWRMRSGARTQDELTETRVTGGRRFDLKSGANEDHFVMVDSGDLEIRAKGALITVAERIKVTPAAAAALAAVRDRNTEVGRFPPAQSASAQPGKEQVGGVDQTSAAAAAAAQHPPRSATPVRPMPRKPGGQQEPKIDLTRFLQPTG